MRYSVIAFLIFKSAVISTAQPILRSGDRLPDIVFRPLVNAPFSAWAPHTQNKEGKWLLLNFWGTWCAPCLPEMDTLVRLQRNNNKIRVIAISNETPDRLRNYLKRRPSGIWLSSDTSANLYRQLNFSYVGQAAFIDPSGRIRALVRTDSINQVMIDRLLRGEPVPSSASTDLKTPEQDPFAVDSSTNTQLTWSGYRPGMQSMSKRYTGTAFAGRRLTYINVCPTMIYRDLYGISYNQVQYEGDEKDYCDWGHKTGLCCIDIVVAPAQHDSLHSLLLDAMDRLSPVRAKLSKKEMDVYVLERLPNASDWIISADSSSYGFSGQGFDGKGITLAPFVDYLANELPLPVIDGTGLKDHYNVHTENILRSEHDILEALKKLGLTVVRKKRTVDILLIYKHR